MLVEDDSTLAFIIADALQREGFDVSQAYDGEAGLERFRQTRPGIVVADVMMPRMDGFEMVKAIRRIDSAVPVLFLTARTAIEDVVKGFGLGANDYLRKPFKIIELVVRVKALLNRGNSREAEQRRIELGDCLFDFSAQRLTAGHDGRSVELSHIEAVILDELMRNHDRVVEARTLMFRIWNNDDYANLNRLHGFIHKLRRHLAPSSTLTLINVRGVGYKLSCKPSMVDSPPRD